ncbi:MAG TPA: chemotaxis protein CheW [Treponema sp.]|nr:chemotaxis protein CheW [Treponema sp.]
MRNKEQQLEEKSTVTSSQFLTFYLAEERYAIDVLKIQEVLEVPRITRVPRMPDFISGVINLRGTVIPVMDIRLKFGLGKTPITEKTSIVVIELSVLFSDGERSLLQVGLFSDLVDQVVDIPLANIEAPPEIGTAIDTSFIQGMGKIGDEFILLLKLDSLLSEQDLFNITENGGPSL